jgi:hypothetical protein
MKTITWSIDKLQVTSVQNGKTHVVVKAFWRCEIVDGDLSAARVGICELTPGDTFIPYSLLTEQQVLDWCFEPKTTTEIVANETITTTRQIKSETETDLEASIADQLAKKDSEPALPWAQIPEGTTP